MLYKNCYCKDTNDINTIKVYIPRKISKVKPLNIPA